VLLDASQKIKKGENSHLWHDPLFLRALGMRKTRKDEKDQKGWLLSVASYFGNRQASHAASFAKWSKSRQCEKKVVGREA